MLFRILIMGFLFLFRFFPAYAQENKRAPNILLILADDLGWSDLSCYGSSFYETPHLDQLAKKGIRFTQNYATSPVCSPTRASLLTGKYPVRTGVTDWIKGRQENGKAKPFEKFVTPPTAYQLAPEEKTIAEFARENGYRTFFAGKWHLGEEEKYWPLSQGFEINKGGWRAGSPTGRVNDSTGGFFTPYKNPVLTDGPPGEYLTDRLTNECLSFLESNTSAPFFMMYSLYAVHNPMQAPAALVRKYEAKLNKMKTPAGGNFVKDEPWMKSEDGWKRRIVQNNPVYAAMIENMDQNIGRLLAKLEQLHLDENTMIIFTSDNGGLSTAEGSPTSNDPLRAGKGWLYEGGIRVPLLLYWKDKIQPGAVTGLPVCAADLFPTVATAINGKYKKDKTVDGENILSMLARPGPYQQRTLYWYYPHYSNQGGGPGSALREGKYKLIYSYETNEAELYDLSADVGERNNIAGGNRGIVERMKKKLLAWIKRYTTPVFAANPLYQPSAQGKAPGAGE